MGEWCYEMTSSFYFSLTFDDFEMALQPSFPPLAALETFVDSMVAFVYRFSLVPIMLGLSKPLIYKL